MIKPLDGKPLRMPCHGIVRKEEFQLAEKSSNRICFTLKSSEAMFQMFPYQFILFNSYEFYGRGIRVTYQVLNRSKEPMPFFIGVHSG